MSEQIRFGDNRLSEPQLSRGNQRVIKSVLCVLRLAVKKVKRKNYPLKGGSRFFDVCLPLSVE